MREVTRTVPAPVGLGLDLVGVPEGSDVELAVRLESVVEGVLVSGTARVALSGECGRCLEPVDGSLVASFQELYAFPESGVTEDEAGRLEGDLLDLEPVVRDAVVLALPLRPLCSPDCLGLCPTCGARLADVGPDHAHADVDPRWAVLAHLASEQDDGQASGTGPEDETDRET